MSRTRIELQIPHANCLYKFLCIAGSFKVLCLLSIFFHGPKITNSSKEGPYSITFKKRQKKEEEEDIIHVEQLESRGLIIRCKLAVELIL